MISLKKVVKRSIAKLYLLSKNEKIHLFLMRSSTKLFISPKNEIDFDKMNNLFWLKNEGNYLFAVDAPYFDFDIEKINNRYRHIFSYNYTPKYGDVIIDVGAGIGAESNYFMKKIGIGGTYYAIEASPESFRKLDLLIKKNQFQNYFCFHLAISNRIGEIWINETENYLISQTNSEGIGKSVRCSTMDDFIDENKISRIDFLKINIEGAEYDMVDSMSSTLTRTRNIAISCHDFLSSTTDDNRIRKKIVSYLTMNNFEVFTRKTGNKVLDSWVYGKNKILC